MLPAPTTRASLLLRLADAGDQRAWAEFVALYEPLVHRLLRKSGLQDADLREVAQDVFFAVSRNVARFEPSRGSFRAWLAAIARNLLVNLLEYRRRRPAKGTGSSEMLQMLAEVPAPDAAACAVVEAERRRRLFHHAADRVRKEFRPATWQAFWQTCVEHEAVTEVGRRLGLTAGAVYIARCRVIARIRTEVERLEAEEQS